MRQGSSTLNARTAIERTLHHAQPQRGLLRAPRAGRLGAPGHLQRRLRLRPTSTPSPGATSRACSTSCTTGAVASCSSRARTSSRSSTARGTAERGAPDEVGADNGRDKINRYVFTENTTALVDKVLASLRERPAKLTYLHIRLPDSAGHGYGWGSGRYETAVRQSSAHVGRILRTISRSDSLRSRAAVVLTADHGGEGKGHADSGRPINYTVPFMTWGSGIAPGGDLYALNPGRVDPGVVAAGLLLRVAAGAQPRPGEPGDHLPRLRAGPWWSGAEHRAAHRLVSASFNGWAPALGHCSRAVAGRGTPA